MVSLVHMGRNAFADASDELSADSGHDESIAKLNGGNVLDLITRVCG
jgi:hypothetical protein